MPLKAGVRLGAFEIAAPLGAGGMGEVYRARDTRLGRDVAIKALPAAFAADLERLSRFRREAQTLASLNHPNIAAIYGLEDANGEPCLVLELVEGETLATRLDRGALPWREALRLCLQIAAAVEAAHERGVVHRDLKPGNVMITPSGIVKVLDFGLAKCEPDLSAGTTAGLTVTAPGPGQLLGTVAYMSPEQARGRSLDRRSDVWSFGCVLFECLTGSAAFTGDTTSDVLARVLEREPEWSSLPSDTPLRAREVLRRCLRKDLEERPRDIRDVRIELSEVSRGVDKADPSHENSIAVLPFENLSGADDEYFADGMTDEVLNALSHLDGFRVAARSSCFAFKGKREDLRTVGERLDVTTVLEGSVRRAGTRLRITVQLVKAADGYQLWSERYDREMTDVFELQEEIASTIATRLRGTLHDEADRRRARQGVKNLEAYELLLKGRTLQMKRGRFLNEAIACFERAIELEPEYAEAMAWLSDSYRLLGTFGAAPPAQVMPKAKELAERALRIDPNLAEAWQTLACVEEQYLWNYDRAAELWERMLIVDPGHARGRGQRAVWALVRGRWSADQAVAEARRAMQDEPLSSWVVAMHSHVLGFAGRLEESLVEAERSLALEPDSFFAQWNLMRSLAYVGHYDRAIEMAPALFRVSGRHAWVLALLAWVYAKVGQREHARAVYDELSARARLEYVSPFWLAVAAASAGQQQESLQHVKRAVAEHEPLTAWGRIIPMWDEVRQLPGIDEITKAAW